MNIICVYMCTHVVLSGLLKEYVVVIIFQFNERYSEGNLNPVSSQQEIGK